MPAGLLGAAAVAGAANTLWQYNRENYMFDVPLRQARDFQKQNVNLARYALFREDIRDLAALTTDKVSNLLVTNTLKVGFVVTVYFNFDRTDEGFLRNSWHDQVLCVALGMTLLTSFFFLMTSIWFAMHALQLAQAITTKLLVQVVRIPMPSEVDISKAATEGKEFEMNFREALRVPFIRDDPNTNQNGQPPRNSSPNLDHTLNSDDISMSDISGLQRLPHRMKTMVKEGIETQNGAPPKPGGPVVTSLNELVYGYENMDKTFSQIEPHLKLLNLVASSWQPFDLYSKVTTVLGSSSLFSGLAFYAIYYLKPMDGSGEVTPEAWCCFLFMSTLAWWNMTIEIAGSKVDMAITALLILVGPGFWLLTDKPSLTLNIMQKFGCPFLIFTQGLWITFLGIRACTFGGVWPHFFTSTRFLNVMHKQKGPIEIPRDIGRKAKEEDQWAWDDTSSSDSADLEDINRAMAIAQPLVDSLSCVALQPQSHGSRAAVIEARDTLREAARAAGVSRSTVLVKGFYISLEMAGDQDREMQWVDPCGLTEEPEYATAPETVSLVEVLETANQVADLLYAHAVKWTVDDMVNLASYGGEPVVGVHSFLYQFETTYEKSAHFRPSADYLFKVAMALVTLFWILALLWSLWFSSNVFNRITLTGSELAWQMPQPWRMVKSFGCQLEGTHFTVTDGYTVQVLNEDGSLYLHFEACGDGPVLAVDFGQGGEVLACCENGTQSTWLANGKVVRQEWLSKFGGLTDLAVDRTPVEAPDHIDAIAIRDNQLLGIVFEDSGAWRIFGALTLPQNKGDTKQITALAIRLGRALVLTKQDEVYEMDVPSGFWVGPMLLPTLGSKSTYDWISVCRLSAGRWRFVGHPGAAPIQLWKFKRPPVNSLPPRQDETHHELAVAA